MNVSAQVIYRATKLHFDIITKDAQRIEFPSKNVFFFRSKLLIFVKSLRAMEIDTSDREKRRTQNNLKQPLFSETMAAVVKFDALAKTWFKRRRCRAVGVLIINGDDVENESRNEVREANVAAPGMYWISIIYREAGANCDRSSRKKRVVSSFSAADRRRYRVSSRRQEATGRRNRRVLGRRHRATLKRQRGNCYAHTYARISEISCISSRGIIEHVGVNVIRRDAGHCQETNVFQKRRENRITLGSGLSSTIIRNRITSSIADPFLLQRSFIDSKLFSLFEDSQHSVIHD